MIEHLTKPLKSGRPKGTTRFDSDVARAFGGAVREARVQKKISQEMLAGIALIDRSFMGRIERGETTPSLALILRIGQALGISATVLIQETERILSEEKDEENR